MYPGNSYFYHASQLHKMQPLADGLSGLPEIFSSEKDNSASLPTSGASALNNGFLLVVPVEEQLVRAEKRSQGPVYINPCNFSQFKARNSAVLTIAHLSNITECL
jgi:hypothetical protein